MDNVSLFVFNPSEISMELENNRFCPRSDGAGLEHAYVLHLFILTQATLISVISSANFFI